MVPRMWYVWKNSWHPGRRYYLEKNILLYYVGEYVSLVYWKEWNILPFFLLFETSKSKFWERKYEVASVQFENLILKI